MTSTRHTNVRLPHFMGYRQTLQTHNAVSGQYYSLLTEYSIKPWEKTTSTNKIRKCTLPTDKDRQVHSA